MWTCRINGLKIKKLFAALNGEKVCVYVCVYWCVCMWLLFSRAGSAYDVFDLLHPGLHQ